MAEAQDRPQGAAETAPASGTAEKAGTLAPTAAESYRPLSLFALVGFGVAVLYGVVVVLGGAIALFTRSPWLMPTWTFFVPVAALILCWLARARIRDAEDTLSGQAFATWGIRLTVLVGLLYIAYYASTFFAVRSQAISCAKQFFEELQKDRPDRAFLLTQGLALNEMDENEIHSTVEGRFNTPRGPSSGMYDLFRRSPFVRAITSAGSQAQFTPTGVSDWGYDQGGYRVLLKYHVATPLVEFDMHVATFGQDSAPGETRGRQWIVVLPKGETTILASTMKVTARGEDFMNYGKMAWDFASTWQDKVNRHDWDDVYLDTLAPADRASLLKGKQAARLRDLTALAGPAALGFYNADSRAFLAAGQQLAQSKLIRIDDQRFWTNKQQRAEILNRVANTFRPGSRDFVPFTLMMQKAELPLLREKDGRMIIQFDAHLIYLDEAMTKSTYMVDGQLIVSAAAAEAGRSPSAWRVDALEPENGRVAPQPGPTAPSNAPKGQPAKQ